MKGSSTEKIFPGEMLHLSRYDSVDSTNNRIKEAIEQGKPEWTVITSRVQEEGYGRQGRIWSSPLGGLYLSLLLRPWEHASFSAPLPTLSLVMSIAVRRALLALGLDNQAKENRDISETVYENKCIPEMADGNKYIPEMADGNKYIPEPAHENKLLIKWPNDILWDFEEGQAKLSGISVEVIDKAVCVGIGINLFRFDKKDCTCSEKSAGLDEGSGSNMSLSLDVGSGSNMSAGSSEGKYRHAYVADLLEEKTLAHSIASTGLSEKQAAYMEDVLAVLLREVHSVYNQWLVEGFSPFRDEYQASASLQGKAVKLVSLSHDILYEGVVCDVDDEGFLCLINADGAVVRAHSGEVHLA